MEREFIAGWRVLLAASLGASVATTALPLYSMGVFIRPLEAAYGWSRANVTMAATIFSFMMPISILTLGYMVDRFGIRRVVIFGHVMLGLAFASLSVLPNNLWAFWGIYALAALLGAGASPIAYTRAVIHYFNHQRGLAIGIFMASAGLGALLAPPLLQRMIDEGGWQAGYLSLAAVVLLVAVVVYLLLSHMDTVGIGAGTRSAPAYSDPTATAVPLSGLPHPRTLLVLICIGIFAVALAVNGYIVHLIPILQLGNMPARDAALVASYVGAAVILGRLITGALMDRVSIGLLGATLFSLATFGVLLLWSTGSAYASLAAVLIGFTVGAEVDLVTYLVSRTFSASTFTRNFSWTYAAFMVGGGLSPLIAAVMFDRAGDYDGFFALTVALMIAIILAFVALHVLQRRSA